MKKSVLFLIAATLASVFFPGGEPMAQKMIDPKPVQVISWLDGRWVKAYGDKFMEEHWSNLGGSFIGMCREMVDGQSTFIEIMVIEPEGADTLMRIRHFGPGLKSAREERDKTAVFRLSEFNGKLAVFEGVGPNEGEKLTYRLMSKELLEITAEFMRDGKKTTEIFRMKKA